ATNGSPFTRRCSSASGTFRATIAPPRPGSAKQKAPRLRAGLFLFRSCAAGSARLRGAPTLVIGLARLRAVGRRADLDLEFDLLVALDGGLLGAAVLLAPQQRELRAGL